eukprot:1451778-Pleurochrysis_carterae.AAC.1
MTYGAIAGRQQHAARQPNAKDTIGGRVDNSSGLTTRLNLCGMNRVAAIRCRRRCRHSSRPFQAHAMTMAQAQLTAQSLLDTRNHQHSYPMLKTQPADALTPVVASTNRLKLCGMSSA